MTIIFRRGYRIGEAAIWCLKNLLKIKLSACHWVTEGWYLEVVKHLWMWGIDYENKSICCKSIIEIVTVLVIGLVKRLVQEPPVAIVVGTIVIRCFIWWIYVCWTGKSIDESQILFWCKRTGIKYTILCTIKIFILDENRLINMLCLI